MNPIKHGGCYVCGSKDEEILTSKKVEGCATGVGLCSKHVNAITVPPKGFYA